MPNILPYNANSPKVLKTLRRRQNLSQVRLGRQLGRSRSFVARVERGERALTAEELKQYLECLSVAQKEYVSLMDSIKMVQAAGKHAAEPDVEYKPTHKRSKEEIIELLQDYFATKPVEEAYLFGSVARNEHSIESDIDIYLSFREDYKVSIFDLSRMRNDIISLTGSDVDLVLKDSEHSFLKEQLHHEKIQIHG